ncbi:MAG TPA: class I SAM-dependent methyltransferase [Candidatus Onthomonas avicola]|nr:class I SAM-dependent methyltransferase [Candidatus Onthomonas avicola]
MKYWNHNAAYYKWVQEWTAGCKSVLDVGCGDGSLISSLDDGSKELVGIDMDASCIARAKQSNGSVHTHFLCDDFLHYKTEEVYDAVVFVASIHHMDMAAALEKSKAMLSAHGCILIVGLAKPSSMIDYVVEGMRVLPCKILTKFKRAQSSEELDLPVSYNLPTLKEVRELSARLLPHAVMRYGLYYRYLLRWIKH